MGQKECSKKARAGTRRGGQHGAAKENCQNGQSRAERGFIEQRAASGHPAETDQHNTHTDSGYVFANPGLDSEAHEDPYMSDHSCQNLNF